MGRSLVDEADNFVVLERNLLRRPASALGQLLRYMGWLQPVLAPEKNVSGVVIESRMDDKLKSAALVMPDVRLSEYSIGFTVTPMTLEPRWALAFKVRKLATM
jgi:hypothetical protein